MLKAASSKKGNFGLVAISIFVYVWYYSKVLTAYQSAIYQQSAYIFNGLLENSQKVYGR